MPDTVMSETAAPAYRNRSAEIDKLAMALSKAQGAMEGAKKDAENPGFKRDGKNATYADLASVWDAIREPLSSNGLSVVQLPTTLEAGVEIETLMLHESGQYLRNVLWMPCGQAMTAHTIGSAITYGRRYGLMALCGIAPEDDDGNAAAGVNAHKPGVPGSASGGTDFRAAGPRRFQGNGPGPTSDWVGDAERDGILDETRTKGTLPAKNGAAKATNGKITPEQRAAKLKDATDKRIKVLKDGAPWSRVGLNDLWTEDTEWIDWMADPTNDALAEYERFTAAFAGAELAIRETV